MEFRVNQGRWSATVNLTDPSLIDIYNRNPDLFQNYVTRSMYSAMGDMELPEEIRPLANEMEIKCARKKLELIRNYQNQKGDSN